MKIFLIGCVLFLCACAHYSPYLQTSNGDPVKQCNMPVLFLVNIDVPESRFQSVSDGFLHWNDIVGERFFFDMGITDLIPSDPEASAFVVVAMDSGDRLRARACAGAVYDYYPSTGCIRRAKILIDPICLKLDNETFETVMRHEAGHILGLGHSNVFGDLMWRKIDKNMQHPVDASTREINAVKKLYGVDHGKEEG